MRTLRTTCFVLALAACKREPAPAPSAPPPAPTTVGAPGSQNLAPLAGIAVRMHEEAASRPAVSVTAEELFDALAARGIELQSKKQVLAATAQASYCALGVTRESVAIAICEYASQDAARAGKELLDSRYGRLVPDAVRSLNGATLVTVANGTGHPAVRDRVLETFRSL
jgi:phenylpyruvate tautomerase PptA (4-oxalocrotonate tautomerase family)